MAVGIVEQLEIVQVADDQRHRSPGAMSPPPFVFQVIAELPVVGQAGQLISGGQELQPVVGQPELFGAPGNQAFKLVLAAADTIETNSVQSVQGPAHGQKFEQVKPPGAPEGRNDTEAERNAVFIPQAVNVGRPDPEGVASGRQVAVGSKAPVSDVVPSVFEAFQHVGILVFLGDGVIQSGKFKGNDPVLPVKNDIFRLDDGLLEGDEAVHGLAGFDRAIGYHEAGKDHGRFEG